MSELTLKADPTFVATAIIPRLGKPSAEVQFTFKHRTVAEFEALVAGKDAAVAAMADPDLVLHLCSGWELAEEFTEANVRTLCQHYPGAGPAVAKAFLREYARARLGN